MVDLYELRRYRCCYNYNLRNKTHSCKTARWSSVSVKEIRQQTALFSITKRIDADAVVPTQKRLIVGINQASIESLYRLIRS